MKRFVVWSASAVSMFFLAFAPVSRAQGPTATPTEVARHEARARFAEGLQLHDAGRDEEARAKFIQAYSVLKHANVLFNLARAEQLSGHEVDAIRHYKLYIRQNDPLVTEQDRETARGYIAALSGRVGRITVVAPDGAVIIVDGVTLDDLAPVREPVDVAPGRHTIVARRGDKVKSVDVTCASGEIAKAEIADDATFAEAAPPPPKKEETVAETSRHGFWTTRNTTTVVIGGVAVIAGSLGILFATQSSSQSDTASGLRTQLKGTNCANNPLQGCQDLANATSSQHTDASLSTGFYVGAAVLAAGAIVTWALWPKERRAGTAYVVPAVGPQGGGVHLMGSF